MGKKKDNLKQAVYAHTNLNTWGAVVTLLEGGLLCGGDDFNAVQQVIKIAHRQQGKHLAASYAAIAADPAALNLCCERAHKLKGAK